jgi:hypothetical protein
VSQCGKQEFFSLKRIISIDFVGTIRKKSPTSGDAGDFSYLSLLAKEFLRNDDVFFNV